MCSKNIFFALGFWLGLPQNLVFDLSVRPGAGKGRAPQTRQSAVELYAYYRDREDDRTGPTGSDHDTTSFRQHAPVSGHALEGRSLLSALPRSRAQRPGRSGRSGRSIRGK